MLAGMARYPTRQVVSAGGLVYVDRPDGRWMVLIALRNAAGTLQWTLPKGGIEAGESPEAAAVREVREETGLDARIRSKLGVIDYWFVWHDDAIRYHKFVHYYAMEHLGGDMANRDEEAEEVGWFRMDQADERMSFRNERALARELQTLPSNAASGPQG